ncbi:uncharacterized protein PV07_04834, partial [Cladophialophora immunda]
MPSLGSNTRQQRANQIAQHLQGSPHGTIGMDVAGYAVITGAGSGIGRATALTLAREGATGIALLDLDQKALDAVGVEVEAAAAACGTPIRVYRATVDVRNESDVTTAINNVAQEFGRLDYLINCAGVAFKHPGGAAEAASEDWSRVVDINLNGTFYALRAAAKIMLQQDWTRSSRDGRPLQRGSIVNIGSICGVVGVALSTAYTASKHGVIGLTRTAAVDYAGSGLRINAVCPGYVDTPMVTKDQTLAEVARRSAEQKVPLQRLARAQEVADSIVFLCGGRSSYITGSTLMVDGGFTAQ